MSYVDIYINFICNVIICIGGLKELKVYKDYYSRLANILCISNITPELLSAGIIDFNEGEAISAKSTSKEKNEFILLKIGNQLESNATESFRSLLNIMKKHGGEVATLASEIMTSLSCK